MTYASYSAANFSLGEASCVSVAYFLNLRCFALKTLLGREQRTANSGRNVAWLLPMRAAEE